MLRHAERLGIQKIELASGVRAGTEYLQECLEEAGQRFDLTLHNYFPAPEEPFVLNLASGVANQRRESIEFCKRAMHLSVKASSPWFSVHAGYVQDLHSGHLGKPNLQSGVATEKEHQDAMKRFCESVQGLLPLADRLGIDLLIENNVHAVGRSPQEYRPSHVLMADPESVVSFFEAIDHPRCGLLLDVAHWKVSSNHLGFDPVERLADVASRVRLLHLSDNDGTVDSNEACRVDSWFWEPLQRFQVLPQTPIVLEAYRLSDDLILDQLGKIEQCVLEPERT